MNNAQLDNEKATLIFQVDMLKDLQEDMEEIMMEVQREARDKHRVGEWKAFVVPTGRKSYLGVGFLKDERE